MQQGLKLLGIFGIIVSTSNMVVAQGTLHATLSPFPSTIALTGSVIVHTPATNVGGPIFSVSYEITLNGSDPIFSVGRIAGGTTAWAFDLNAPILVNGSALYNGATSMTAAQISDMLGNRTYFEANAYAMDGAYIGVVLGPLVSVPEPRSSGLLFGAIMFILFRWYKELETTGFRLIRK